jgi:hypothetical protein
MFYSTPRKFAVWLFTPRGSLCACNHVRTNHVLFVYNPAGIPADHRGCYQASDAVTYKLRINKGTVGLTKVSVTFPNPFSD